MKFDNPLRIFTNDQFESFDPIKLKSFQNELQARFKLSRTETIDVNGVEINKKQLQNIFDQLNQNFKAYQYIVKNRRLNDFLQNGDLKLLNDESGIQSLKENFTGKTIIEDWIVARLQDMIAQFIKSPNVKNHSRLKSIKQFLTQWNPLLIDKAYAPAYESVDKHINYLINQFTSPFSPDKYDSFHPNLRKHVNLEYYESFELLSPSFKPLATKYSKWCNDVIVEKSIEVENDITQLSRESLYTLKNAASIAGKEFDNEQNHQIVYQIKRHFDKRSKNFSQYTKVALAGLVIIYVLRIGASMVRHFDNQTKSDPYSYNRRAIPESDEVKATKLEARKKLAQQKQDLIDNPIRNSKYNILEYGGEKSKGINAKLVSEKERDGYTEQWYTVNVHPSKSSVFKYILPPELGEKHLGKVWPVVMNFKNPSVKNSTLQHKVYFDFKKERKIYPQRYMILKSGTEEPLDITLKPIPFAKYPLSGSISRIHSENGEKLYSSTFKISYNEETEIYFVTLGSSGKKMSFTKDYISQMDPKYAIEEYDKFALAIRNTNLIIDKNLEQGKTYPIYDVMAYTFEEFNKTKFQSRKLVNERAFLKYYITSIQDSTAYVELNGQYVNLKYFADSKSGEIKGMTMVNSSDSSEGMETMTIFGKK